MLVSLIINLVYSFQEAVRFLHVGSLRIRLKKWLKALIYKGLSHFFAFKNSLYNIRGVYSHPKIDQTKDRPKERSLSLQLAKGSGLLVFRG